MNLPLGDDVDFVTISNIGFVDGELHIQTKWTESVDNHGDVKLVTKGHEIEESEENVPYDNYYFFTETDERSENQRSKHIEFVYQIKDLSELEQYELWSWFVEDGDFTEGDWRVNFRLDQKDAANILPNE